MLPLVQSFSEDANFGQKTGVVGGGGSSAWFGPNGWFVDDLEEWIRVYISWFGVWWWFGYSFSRTSLLFLYSSR